MAQVLKASVNEVDTSKFDQVLLILALKRAHFDFLQFLFRRAHQDINRRMQIDRKLLIDCGLSNYKYNKFSSETDVITGYQLLQFPTRLITVVLRFLVSLYNMDRC